MPTILVIDDETITRKIIALVLKKQNFKVVEAINGKEGSLIAKKYQPDLIISDIKMPVMDGIEAFVQKSADPEISHIPVLFISSTEDALQKIKNLGAAGFIKKPVLPERLTGFIAAKFTAVSAAQKTA